MSQSRFQIRPMTEQDIPQVLEIERQSQFHPWSARQFTESLTAGQHCTVLVANNTGKQMVVGFCILQTVLDEANLLLMAIDPDHRGQGLGADLLETSITHLGDGCVMVFLEVRQSNQAAIRLYEKLDFHQTGLRKNYYPADPQYFKNGKEDAVIMVLTRGNPFQMGS